MTGADCWGQSVPAANANPPGYDRYGNLLTINVSKCSPPGLSISISVKGNNQVSGYSYDAAGDVTYDGTYNYSWDAENRLTSAAGVTYTYDGDGQRVKKSSGTLYWRGGSGGGAPNNAKPTKPSCTSVFFDALGDFLNPFNPTLASSVTYADTAATTAANVAMGSAIAANTAKLAFEIGSPARIALAIRAASWTRLAVDAAEMSGEFAVGAFILGELYAMRAQGAAIRQGTCQL